MTERRRTRARTVALLATCAAAGVAAAYQLPATTTASLTVEWRQDLKVRTMRLQARVLLGEGPGTIRATSEEWIAQPYRWRIEMHDDRGDTLFIRDGYKTYWKPPDGPAEWRDEAADPLTLTLAGGFERDTLVNGWKTLGINPQKMRFDRFQGVICAVIGAAMGDHENPQLWVDKDQYYPTRFIYSRPGSKTKKPVRVEQRYLDWSSPVTGEWFPRVTEELRDGYRVYRREVDAITVNETFDESLFTIPRNPAAK